MSMNLNVVEKSTKPFDGQKPGTSGLRKPTKTFLQENYTENFVQSILTAASLAEGAKLVLCGDGRYFVKDCLSKIIIPMCAANGISEVIVGQNGLLSTPAASCVIRKYKCQGGILLTASHNPGGLDADFGIKYNCENGGPAPEKVTEAIYQVSKSISSFKTLEGEMHVDIDSLGVTNFELSNGKQFKVLVISSTDDYMDFMKELFDFNQIKVMLSGSDGKPAFKLLASGLYGVMGPYIKRILCQELGMDAAQALKADTLEDFGGGHPDPNLTYAADLLKAAKSDPAVSMAVAFDGDGDRNMIIGREGFFVSPCDSLAVIADNYDRIKYFKVHGVTGFARSMPTSRAIDKVCEVRGIPCYEVPTGWKFFGNLMDSKLCCLCGEESFGTGSDHIREKDGMWAVLAWLSILASRRAEGLSYDVDTVMREHWRKYGRHFFTRYDYEGCESAHGDTIIQRLEAFITKPELPPFCDHLSVDRCDNYSYTDPVDKSVSSKQGVRVYLSNGARMVFRLSGTGSSGATLRVYIDCFERDETLCQQESALYLAPLIDIALTICSVGEITGRRAPTVIT